MKLKYFILFISIGLCSSIFSQRKDTIYIPQIDTVNLVDNPDIPAKFTYGDKKLNKFIQSHLDSSIYEFYYNYVKKVKSGILVLADVRIESLVKLVVDENGRLYNIDVIKSYPIFIKSEIERILLLSQIWLPAFRNGVAVKARKTITVTFHLRFNSEFRKAYFAKYPERS